MLRVAVLGCGRIGRMHARNVAAHPRASLAAVYDIHRPSAEEVAKALGVKAAETPQAIFSSPDIDAVLVATSTETHSDYIEQAVAAGKPVLCEKPIDLSLARVNRCAEAIKGSKVPVQIGFNRRFDPGHRALWKSVRAGDIGDLHQVIITSRDPAMPPRSYYEVAGGLFRDMTIHDFDLARFMLGEEPVDVFAIAGRQIDPAMMNELGDSDSAMVIMRTASGRQCHINNHRQAVYGYDQRVECQGTAGMALSDNRKPHEMRRHAEAFTGQAAPYLNFFIERYSEAFNAELSAFVDAIEKGRPPEVGFDDGRRALILAEAAMKSVAERRIVKVSEIG
ncbi:MAG: inositol 2-dehydrogenase [Devosia nanyangense]|uniref:Inositol 2-dehydrogenase n=1 Tax=Devosia nanyangense TaxID=1228055 RepID=A0A933L467_9HYPH|nr:inositol 2-dehydrogenase [Devosia nanyangense]